MPEDLANSYLAKGRLKRVLEEGCPPWSGYRLTTRRWQQTPAFSLMVEAPRYRLYRRSAAVDLLAQDFEGQPFLLGRRQFRLGGFQFR